MIPVPVTVLCGFLGAGKTSVLSHLLRNRESSLRIGLVINDLSALNVDERLLVQQLQEGISEPGHAVILEAVSDSCACCSGADGVVAAVSRLASREPPMDCIVVECTGVALPDAVARQLTAHPLRFALDTLVTVVDCEVLERWLHPSAEGSVAEWAVAESLARQVEHADRVVLTRADRAGVARVARCRAAVRALNPGATLHAAHFGAIPDAAAVLLRTGSRAAAVAAVAGYSHGHNEGSSHDGGHGHGNVRGAGEAGGFVSIIVTATRPLVPSRLASLVSNWRNAGAAAMAGVVRGKGQLCIASSPGRRLEFALAGRRIELLQGAEGGEAATTALVFIGTPGEGGTLVGEAHLRAEIAACELTDVELAAGPTAAWAEWIDALSVSAPLHERARAAMAPAHPPACPCCDPELRALDRFIAAGGL